MTNDRRSANYCFQRHQAPCHHQSHHSRHQNHWQDQHCHHCRWRMMAAVIVFNAHSLKSSPQANSSSSLSSSFHPLCYPHHSFLSVFISQWQQQQLLSLHFTNPKHRIIAVGRLPNYDRKPWSSSIPDVCVHHPRALCWPKWQSLQYWLI